MNSPVQFAGLEQVTLPPRPDTAAEAGGSAGRPVHARR